MKEIVRPDVLFVNPCLPTLPKEVVYAFDNVPTLKKRVHEL